MHGEKNRETERERERERRGNLEVGMASEKKEFRAKVKGDFTTLRTHFSFSFHLWKLMRTFLHFFYVFFFYNPACCLPLVSYFLFVTHFIRSLSHLIPLILPHCFSFLSLRPLHFNGKKRWYVSSHIIRIHRDAKISILL